jgi:hypothetical protein
MKLEHIPWLIIVILISALAFYFWNEQRTTRELLTLKNKELMQSNLELGRAQSEIVSQKKAHATAIANLDKLWKDEIKSRNAVVTAYGQLEALYVAEKKKQKTVTKIVYRDRIQEIEVPTGEIFFKDESGNYHKVTSLQYNYNDFRITIHGDAVQQHISYKLHQKFKAQFVATKLPTGGVNHYAEIYEVGPNGERLDKMELTSFEVLQAEDLPNRFMWFNPKLDLMIGGGVNGVLQGTWIGDIGLFFAAYGKTPDDITLRFVRFGIGMTRHGFSLTGSPIQLNFGKFLPLVSNLWITPFGGFDFGANAGLAGFGIAVVF